MTSPLRTHTLDRGTRRELTGLGVLTGLVLLAGFISLPIVAHLHATASRNAMAAYLSDVENDRLQQAYDSLCPQLHKSLTEPQFERQIAAISNLSGKLAGHAIRSRKSIGSGRDTVTYEVVVGDQRVTSHSPVVKNGWSWHVCQVLYVPPA